MVTPPMSLSHIMQQGPSRNDPAKSLEQLRYAVLADGIPSNSDGISELRIYVWLILLAVSPLPTDTYVDLVRQGASPSYAKIRNDTFRTFSTNPLFRRRVTENSLSRVLNAVAWRLQDAHEAQVNGWQSPPSIGYRPPLSFSGSPEGRRESAVAARAAMERDASDGGMSTTTPPEGSSVGYVQGMNVLAAPFLYAAHSEVQAFAGFNKLITTVCPGYVRGGSMDGVHKGLALVDEVLKIVDVKLYAYLMSKDMTAKIYGFASVLTLSACTPPLPEVLVLWDFLFAYGPHLNLLCIVAQLVLIRDQLLTSSSPNQILRSFPPLQSAKIKAMAISFVRKLPGVLYDQIVAHAK